jgi:hypothetical protein
VPIPDQQGVSGFKAQGIAGVVGLRDRNIQRARRVSSQDLQLFYRQACPVAVIIGRLRLS